MKLIDILDERITDLKMNTENKNETLIHLSKILKKAGYITDVEEFLKDIYIREEIGVTGIGDYIAIPHGKSRTVEKNGIAIGRLNKEIEWETIDGKGVKIVFLFAVSNSEEYEKSHIKLLSEFAKSLTDENKVRKLLQVSKFEDLVSVFI